VKRESLLPSPAPGFSPDDNYPQKGGEKRAQRVTRKKEKTRDRFRKEGTHKKRRRHSRSASRRNRGAGGGKE